MIKILIIEDEIPARKKLKRFLEDLALPVEVLSEIDTVEGAIAFLKVNKPDLILSDIELLDGNSFEIYQQVNVSCPIIFTTAYDQFWMDAFDSNGIAYLLKPFSKERFQKAWDKFMLLRSDSKEQKDVIDGQSAINQLTQLIQQNLKPKIYKKRFTISNSQELYFLDTSAISFFGAEEGVVFANDLQGKRHLLNEATLKEIEDQLDPEVFYRINRAELIAKFQIEKVERYNKNALAVKMKGYDAYLKTSQSNTAAFRAWLEN